MTRYLVSFVCLSLVFSPLFGQHRETDVLLYGTVTGNGQPLTALSTNYALECRKTPTSPAMASYTMGESSLFNDFYGLRIPLQAQAPESDLTVADVGDVVILAVVVEGQDVLTQEFLVEHAGIAVRLDLEFWGSVTTALAGEDQEVCGTSTTLQANAGEVGEGEWFILSGQNGVLDDPAKPEALFSGEANQIYTLEWRISHPVYPNSADQVTIAFFQALSADAGFNLISCEDQVTLDANAPRVGQGEWTIISGEGGYFEDSRNPDTSFTGQNGQTYSLQWAITDEPCEPTSDTVQIKILPQPEAGPNQLVCGTQTVLQATPLFSEQGTWTIESGIGGTFVDTHNPGTAFIGVEGQNYELRWQVTEPGLCSRSDSMFLTLSGLASELITTRTTMCDLDTGFALYASAHCGQSPYSYSWMLISGPPEGGTFSAPDSSNTLFHPQALGVYQIQLEVSDASGGISRQQGTYYAIDADIDGVPGLSWHDWTIRLPYWQTDSPLPEMDINHDGIVTILDLLISVDCVQ